MKVVLYATFFLVFSTAAFAQTSYSPLKLFDMATSADIVTYGVITKLDGQFFYLDCFSGSRKRQTLRILKVSGKPGFFRWEQYAVGQQVFVFLRKNGPIYTVISPGPEGEIPVLKDSLVIDMQCFMPQTVQGLAPKGLTAEYRATQTFAVGKKKVFGLRFTPQYLYQSIMTFRDCYQVILKKPNTIPSFNCFNFFDRRTRDKQEVQKRKSKLMKLMYMDMEEAQIKNCK